jgi:hypothetical protein
MSAQAQNLLVNGNFATGSLAPWVPFTTSNGTNGQGLPNVVLFSGGTWSAHFNVGEVNFDQTEQGGGISQVFNVSSAGTYTYGANFASEDDTDGLVNADAGTFSLIIDGSTLATKALGGFTSPHQVLRGSFSGTTSLTAGSHTFAIQITRVYISERSNTPTQGVTNLSVTAGANRVHKP